METQTVDNTSDSGEASRLNLALPPELRGGLRLSCYPGETEGAAARRIIADRLRADGLLPARRVTP